MRTKEDLHRYVNLISQDNFDEWAKGQRSLADLVREHHFLASLYKSKIENTIHQHDPEDFLEIFQEERPDIDFGDRQKVLDRIEEEMEEIEHAL
ncbi:MAG: hypothetical protein ACLFVL_01905 [Candidatus Aenigmatarchaeota archaeon]